MKKVLILKGLPASGKSTYARKLIDDNPGQYKRINKDDLRGMLDNGKWSKDNEKFILKIRDQLIISALEDGKNVIVDDTNLHHKHEDQIRQLVKGKAKVEVMGFCEVDVEECIRRDLLRPVSVGEKVIRDMYRQFLKPKPEVYSPSPSLPGVVLCDIDGTLALMDGRGPFEWDKVDTDKLNMPVRKLLLALDNIPIILFSGRDEVCRKKTELWLKSFGIKYDGLFMRPTGDIRKDSIIKKELFDQHIRGKFWVHFVLDDRDQVVDMWRNELGLPCFQVAEGNF